MTEESNMQDLTKRISSLKVKRESLVAVRAEKVAQLKRAQEDFKKVYDEIVALGHDPNNIAAILEQKKAELEELVATTEKAMLLAETDLKKYDKE